jgi:hypothetical protein
VATELPDEQRKDASGASGVHASGPAVAVDDEAFLWVSLWALAAPIEWLWKGLLGTGDWLWR